MRRLNPHLVALGILGALLLLAFIFIFATANSDQDRLGDEEATANLDFEDPEARCADPANYDRIKQEVFRRASQSADADQEAFAELGRAAVLRAETPILRRYDQQTNAVSCTAYVSIDLPPGVAIPGGRRTLTAEVAYTVQDGDLSLTSADALISPLTNVARVEEPAEPVANEMVMEDGAAEAEPGVDPSQSDSATSGSAPANAYPGRPSFDCDDASTRGEVAVCQNPGLSALDVSMAAQYRRAVAAANPQQRAILVQTRDRFLSYRDNCPTIGCMRDAYTGRMREIRDIMEGRWRPR